jgi:[ribosomal protein S5]-alanine N-acetyltransferase
MVGEAKSVARTFRVIVRYVVEQDEQEFTELAGKSVDLHRPWIHAPATASEFQRFLAHLNSGSREEGSEGLIGDSPQGLVVCDRGTSAIVGFINLNEIVLGPYRRGLLGYGVFEPYAAQGYMTEGLREVLSYSFNRLKLHRLEADIQPGNDRSKKLVKRLGFICEGLSAGFICIDGEWTDHERWAITSEMFQENTPE